jgi:hypothetical protein
MSIQEPVSPSHCKDSPFGNRLGRKAKWGNRGALGLAPGPDLLLDGSSCGRCQDDPSVFWTAISLSDVGD